MKKWIAAVGIIALFGITFHVGVTVGAGSSEPGSAGDPLITESYLEQRLAEVSGSGSSSTSSVMYKEVTIASGKVITMEEGSELILYSGSGVVSSGSFVNLSSGTIFSKDTNFVKYNVMLAVKSSSKVKATSNMTVFIRGKYSMN